MNLRPYQQDAIRAANRSLHKHRSCLLVLPTGTGKTVIFTSMAEKASKRVLILAHREELVAQAAAKCERFGMHAEIEMANRYSNEHGFKAPKVVVSSVQTLNRPRRMRRFAPNDFSLVITDEAHHAVSKSYRNIYEYFHGNDSIKMIGVTATADRGDKIGLGEVFEDAPYIYEISDAIEDGYLVPIKQRSVVVEDLDFSKIKTTAGDLNAKQLSELMEGERVLHEVAAPAHDLIAGRKAIVFASSIDHATKLTEIFNRYDNRCAAMVTGKTDREDRKSLLKQFRNEQFNILVNVGVFTEGFDEPGIQCVVLARPTKSRALYAQMVGRGTRPLDGLVDAHGSASDRRDAIASSTKPYVDVLDFSGNAGHHKLMTAADILAGKNLPEQVLARAKELIDKSDGDMPVSAALTAAEGLVAAEQQRAELERQKQLEQRRKSVVAQAQYLTAEVDPFGVCPPPRDMEAGLLKDKLYNERMSTTNQIKWLDKFGVKRPDELTFQQASKLLGELFDRRKEGLCTYKQARLLARHGYSQQDIASMTFGEASERIDAITRKGRAAC